MAKAAKLKIKLLSTADTGFFTDEQEQCTKTDKLSFRYDPVSEARQLGNQDQGDGVIPEDQNAAFGRRFCLAYGFLKPGGCL